LKEVRIVRIRRVNVRKCRVAIVGDLQLEGDEPTRGDGVLAGKHLEDLDVTDVLQDLSEDLADVAGAAREIVSTGGRHLLHQFGILRASEVISDHVDDGAGALGLGRPVLRVDIGAVAAEV
jgi:hypothetical protein